MPKPKSGGKRSNSVNITAVNQQINNLAQQVAQTAPPVTPTPITPPTLQQIASGNVMPAGGTPFSQFAQMDDDGKADVIMKSLGIATPPFLEDSDAQKLAYFTGMSDKPQVVTEAQLNAAKGTDIWRSVKGDYNKITDINMTGKDIYNQIATGDFTCYSGGGSGTGASAYGKAIYFDTQKGSYGSGAGYTIIHAKFSSNANVGDYNTLMRQMGNEISSGSKLGQALSRVDRSSRISVYALAKGYDAYQDGRNGYRMIVNRRCLMVSDTTF